MVEIVGNLIQCLIWAEKREREQKEGGAIEDGWGQVRGHKSVFFMLQIRSRCRWDYTASVITHPTAQPPFIHSHTTHTHTHKRRKGEESFTMILSRGRSISD